MEKRKVVKRDGRIVDFDPVRIRNAVMKAMLSVKQYDEETLEKVVSYVLGFLNERYEQGVTPHVEDIQDLVEFTLVKFDLYDVAKSYILYRKERERIREEKKALLQKDFIDEVDKEFSVNAIRLLVSRYLLRDEEGKLGETPKQMFQRVAMMIVIPDILHDPRIFLKDGGLPVFPSEEFNAESYTNKFGLGKNGDGYTVTWNSHHLERMKTLYDELNSQGRMKVSWSVFLRMLGSGEFDNYYDDFKEYYGLMVSRRFMPNSPTLFNAGTRLGQLSACFVLDIEDNIESIMNAATQAAIIFKSGGGVGINYSKLRPAGDIVSSTSGVASGPVSFMRIIDTVTDVVKQGGKRRGANMGILEVNHPDIEAFIMAKSERGRLENFNISVLVEEAFWDYLDNDAPYPLVNPRDGRIWRSVQAKEVLRKMSEMAWRTGDPGVIFLDNINRRNMLAKHRGPIRSTNPCVSGDTRILTPDGWIRADELFHKARLSGQVKAVAIDEDLLGDGGEPQAYRTKLVTIEGEEVVYRTVHGEELNLPVPREAEAWVWHVGKKPGLVVRTEEGYELTVTYDHKLLTQEGWKKAKDLAPGDKVLTSRFHPWFLEYVYKGSYNLDEDVSFVLGWLVGDGSFNKHYIAWFFNEDDKAAEECIRRGIEKIGGNPLSHTYVISKSEHKIQYNKDSTVYKNMMNLMGSLMEKSRNRRFPEVIWKLSPRSLAFFLKGLFTADGYVDNDRAVRLTSASLQILKEAQLLLTIFGIASRIYERPYEGEFHYVTKDGEERSYTASSYYELVINGYSRRIFKELIGFENISKLEKLSLKKTKRDSLLVTVSSLEDVGRVDFYDFTVPAYHKYIGNGFINHNCGEEPLYPYESCNLGSINLYAFVKRNGKETHFDWEEYCNTIRIALRFLDNVIDVNRFPIPEIERETKQTRKVGLGVMGLADMLFALRIPYNSEEGFKMMNMVAEHLTFYAMKESCKLSRERGTFPLYLDSSYPDGEMPIEGFYHKEWQTLPWQELQQEVKRFGMRNAEVTTIAPTGSISMLVDVSSGIEPQFALIYEKRVSMGTFYYVDTEFEKTLNENGLYEEKTLKLIADNGGSLVGLDSIPRELADVFLIAYDIPWWDHVRAQSEFTKWICAAVSKTINMPNWVTAEDVEKAFMLAHAMRVKGVTIYRDGSLPSQVLVTPSSKLGRYVKTFNNSTLKVAESLGIEIKGYVGETANPLSGKMMPEKPVLILERNTAPSGYTECPNCGSKRLIKEGGCLHCLDCGWSICPVA
ncbi:MAG: ribonucleotide reductase N-terminal alpha domain-containing protein [Thermoproteota archaeon]